MFCKQFEISLYLRLNKDGFGHETPTLQQKSIWPILRLPLNNEFQMENSYDAGENFVSLLR